LSSSEKIRVLRIINRFNIGGPTYNAAYLTKYLDPEIFETKLVGGAKDESEASSEYIIENLGIETTIVPEMKREISKLDFLAYKKIKAIILDFKPHIIHTHASKAGTLGRLAGINNHVPIILHTFHGHVFHSYFGSLKTQLYKEIERWLAKRSTRIIAISPQQKLEIGLEHKICAQDKIEVIPLGFDLSRFQVDRDSKRIDFRAKYGLGPADVAIVIVGRLVPVKNHSMFIRAAKNICDSGLNNVRFFIVGDGESKHQIQKEAKEIDLNFVELGAPSQESPLCFTSWIKDVDWVYAGSDIVCLTSLNEGTPVSLIEAQSAGKPIVSTKVGGIHDIVVENESAYLCEKNDVVSFEKHLLKLIDNRELRAKMGQFGEANVIEMFSFKRLVNDIEGLYKRLLDEKNIKLYTDSNKI
jgi:glycosyltransferase involved in cell wall biosynthesis